MHVLQRACPAVVHAGVHPPGYRFALEVADAVCGEVGADRVGSSTSGMTAANDAAFAPLCCLCSPMLHFFPSPDSLPLLPTCRYQWR